MNQMKFNNAKSEYEDWLEYRRIRAWELKQSGWKQCDIAEALDVTPGAVSQWIKRAREGGLDALKSRSAPGREPKLSASERKLLCQMLDRGALSFGFEDDSWTTKRVAVLIQAEFGVNYHPAHVSRVLRKLDWNLADGSFITDDYDEFDGLD